MNIKFSAIIAVWLLIAPALLYAQATYTLKGKITTVDGKEIEGVAVYLNRAADSALVKTALTDTGGNYYFSNLQAGNYRLAVTMVGYRAYKSKVFILEKDTMLTATAIEQTSTALKTVSVTAQRPLVEHLIDRTVVNADALISNAGGTALDVLEKSPA